jgi:hypothetical protein
MQKWLYPLTSICSILLLIVFHQLNEVPVDTGDGLAHYFISKNSISHPSDLLNHWGKPIFTMLSAPFAYFGFQAYVFFNIIIFSLTLFVGHRIFKHFQISSPLTLLFPLVLLGSMDYAANVLGGMTEVLFGFFVLLAGLLALKKRWLWFALLISIMPYVRSEGQMLLPLAAILLIFNRAFIYIFLFVLVFIVISNFGWGIYGDYWWYFTHNPYQGAIEIYGQGEWYHYIVNWHLHLGLPGLLLMLVGLAFFVKHIREKTYSREKIVLSLYFGVIYFGIIFVHAYLWANGKSGALGLSRLAIHGLPGLVLICILAIDAANLKSWFKPTFTGAMVIISVLCIRDYPFVYDQAFPKKAMPDERAVMDASAAMLHYLEENKAGKVYYYHPLVAYKTGANLKDQNGRFIQKSFGLFEAEFADLNNGDLIIWDSHFAKRDMNFPEEETQRFEQLFIFTPFNQMVHKGDAVAKVKVLRVNKSKRPIKQSTSVIFENKINVSSDSLYTNMTRISNSKGSKESYQLQITKTPSNGQLYFVIQHDATGQALTLELDDQNAWKFSLPSDLLGDYKVFIHNPEGIAGEVEVKMWLWRQ